MATTTDLALDLSKAVQRAAELAERIAQRRADRRDPALALLRDHPLEVALHVGRHRRGMTGKDLEADILEAWMILDLITAQVDRARELLIDAGTAAAPHGAGMTYVQIAPLVGQTSKAGVEALRRRLEAAAAGLPKDTKAARANRRGEQLTRERGDSTATLAAVIVASLQRHREQVPSARLDDLDDLLDQVEALEPGQAPDRMFAIDTAVLVRQLHACTLPAELRAAVNASAERLGLKFNAPPGVDPGALESVS
jgi:hypothetical protein